MYATICEDHRAISRWKEIFVSITYSVRVSASFCV